MSKELVQQLAPVLWDVDPATVDPERHAGFLVQRVLEWGTETEWELLCSFLGPQRVEAIAAALPRLEPEALAFCARYFGRPQESFACYGATSSPRAPWIS